MTVDIPSLSDLTDQIKSTLQAWVDIHFDPEAWAENWVAGDTSYDFCQNPVLSNDYFYFDWYEAVLKNHAKGLHWVRCPGCGETGESWEIGCGCEDDPEDLDLDETLSYLRDYYPTSKDLNEIVSDSTLLRVLETEGFEAYAEGVHPTTRPIRDEIEDALRDIDNAETPEDLLSALTWALHLQHVNGNICRDYGNHSQDYLEYEVVNALQQEGLSAYYTDQDLSDYLTDTLGVAA